MLLVSDKTLLRYGKVTLLSYKNVSTFQISLIRDSISLADYNAVGKLRMSADYAENKFLHFRLFIPNVFIVHCSYNYIAAGL